jgi:predicted MPP superfamily phosphohydrolase
MNWAIRTILTICLLALPLILYLGLRLAFSFARLRPGSRRAARRVVAGVVLWFCLFPLLVLAENYLGMARNRFELVSAGPLVDYLVVYPFWVALIVAAELTPVFLLIDLVSIAGRLRPSFREQWLQKLAMVRVALATAGVLFISVHVFVDTSHVRDTVVRIRIHSLPRTLEGLRMTVVGDVQVDRYTGGGKIDQLRRIVESGKPDLLFSPGDVITGGTDYLDAAMSAMCGLKGSVASIAVMGDHDYWSAPDAIVNRFQDCRWDFLDNEHRILQYHGSQILVTGLTHIYSQRLNESTLDSILSRAPQADLRILLVHQPARWLVESAARYGYHLVLAGHTHGGQIVLHPLGMPFTPSMRETPYFTGEYRLGSMSVVVTNGIGLTLAPVRYFAPAEVTTVVLEGEEGGRGGASD